MSWEDEVIAAREDDAELGRIYDDELLGRRDETDGNYGDEGHPFCYECQTYGHLEEACPVLDPEEYGDESDVIGEVWR